MRFLAVSLTLVYLVSAFVRPFPPFIGKRTILLSSSSSIPSVGSPPGAAPEVTVLFYKLVDEKGLAYKGFTISALSVSPRTRLYQLRQAIVAENKRRLSVVDVADLQFFASLEDLRLNNKPPLSLGCFLSNVPKTSDAAPLYVVVPLLDFTLQQVSLGPLPLSLAANSERRKRWQLLNPILNRNKKSRTTVDGTTTPYSGVTWASIRSVYNLLMEDYDLKPEDIDPETLDKLYEYLTKATNTFERVSSENEALRLHFISPVLVHVCNLFDDSVKILVDESLDGTNIDVNGRFEFVLQRQNERVCVVEAKSSNMDQGLAQDLLGCEAMADLENLDCVHGIVTNYIYWIFLKSPNSRVERCDASLDFVPGHQTPTEESVKKIAGLIYAMLLE